MLTIPKMEISKLKIIAILICFMSKNLMASPNIWIDQQDTLFGNKVISKKDDQKIETGLFQTADIRPLVFDNEEALALAIKSNDYSTYGNIIFWTTYPTGFAIMLSPFFVPNDSVSVSTGFSLIALGAVVSMSGIFFAQYFINLSQHYMLKSINIYNGVTYPDVFGYKRNQTKHANTYISTSFNF